VGGLATRWADVTAGDDARGVIRLDPCDCGGRIIRGEPGVGEAAPAGAIRPDPCPGGDRIPGDEALGAIRGPDDCPGGGRIRGEDGPGDNFPDPCPGGGRILGEDGPGDILADPCPAGGRIFGDDGLGVILPGVRVPPAPTPLGGRIGGCTRPEVPGERVPAGAPGDIRPEVLCGLLGAGIPLASCAPIGERRPDPPGDLAGANGACGGRIGGELIRPEPA